MKTIKESCLERMIFFGEDSLRNAGREFMEHYHLERSHQGLGNALIMPIKAAGETMRRDRFIERLGKLPLLKKRLHLNAHYME